MNILIVKLSAIGDVIHTLPALAALRKHFPDAHITWLIEEAAADLIRNHPLLDDVIVSRRKGWKAKLASGRPGEAWRDFRTTCRKLRARRYDLVIDFHGLFKSAFWVWLSGAKRKLGYDSLQELSGLFYNEKIPEDFGKHAVDRYLDFARYLGAKTTPVEFVLPDDPQSAESARALLEQYQLSDKRFIAINPVAYWDTKLWEDRHFSALADRIREELDLPVVFTAERASAISPITALMTQSAVNLAGLTSLLELAWIYRQATAVVTTDSGPMHLAAAVETPVIALFGPTDPARTGPYGGKHTVIRSAMYCSPCLRKTCETTQCMKDITQEQVFDALKQKLEMG